MRTRKFNTACRKPPALVETTLFSSAVSSPHNTSQFPEHFLLREEITHNSSFSWYYEQKLTISAIISEEDHKNSLAVIASYIINL